MRGGPWPQMWTISLHLRSTNAKTHSIDFLNQVSIVVPVYNSINHRCIHFSLCNPSLSSSYVFISPSFVPLQLSCEYSNYRGVCLTFTSHGRYSYLPSTLTLGAYQSAFQPFILAKKAETEPGMHVCPMCTCAWRARMGLRSYEEKKRAVIYIFFLNLPPAWLSFQQTKPFSQQHPVSRSREQESVSGVILL